MYKEPRALVDGWSYTVQGAPVKQTPAGQPRIGQHSKGGCQTWQDEHASATAGGRGGEAGESIKFYKCAGAEGSSSLIT